MLKSYHTWDWTKFKGSSICLKLNHRDLGHLDSVMAFMRHRGGMLRTVVQAGGNLGIFPKYLSQHFDTVYTFEPSPELFPLMTANAPEHNIVRFQSALGEGRAYVGVSQTRRYKHHMPPHEGVTHVRGDGVIPVMTVDGLVLPSCDLIYLDIEGYELYALRGAAKTLSVHRPVVVTEINDCIELSGLCKDDLFSFMDSAGYSLAFTCRQDYVWAPREAPQLRPAA